MASSQQEVAPGSEHGEQLIAASGRRQITVSQLREPDLDLSYKVKDGQLEVSLRVPVSSGDAGKMPFLQVTRDPEVSAKLLNQAQGTIVDNYPGLTVGPIKTSAEAGGDFKVFSFKVNVGADFSLNSQDFKGLRGKIETQFDETRRNIYYERAHNWTQDGGARVPDKVVGKDGKVIKDDVYVVSDLASVGYLKFSDQRYNQQHPDGVQRNLGSILEGMVNARRGLRSDADTQPPGATLASADGVQRAPAANALDDPNNALHKIYREMLSGVKAQEAAPFAANTQASDKDIAVALLQESLNRGAKANSQEQISVITTKDGGLIAVQGSLDSPASPSAKINPADVQPNSAQSVADRLTQNAAIQTIAQDVPQQTRQMSPSMA
jgi:hypothetical protein